MYISRALEPTITDVSGQFPVLFLTSARHVGKTTLLKHLGENGRVHVTLDDPLVLRLAKSDPALFMQRFPPPVLIDEVQYGLSCYRKSRWSWIVRARRACFG